MICKACRGIIIGTVYARGGTSPLCFRCFEELEALSEHARASDNLRRAKAAKRDLSLLGRLLGWLR